MGNSFWNNSKEEESELEHKRLDEPEAISFDEDDDSDILDESEELLPAEEASESISLVDPSPSKPKAKRTVAQMLHEDVLKQKKKSVRKYFASK